MHNATLFLLVLLQRHSFVSSFSTQQTNKNNNNNNNEAKKIELTPTRCANIARSVAKSDRRKVERKSTARPLCARCSRPFSVCVCQGLPKEMDKRISLRTHVLVLQHPNEFRKKTVSTVPLMPLVLENFSKQVGYSFEMVDIISSFQNMNIILPEGRKPLLLYPGPHALSLEKEEDLNILKQTMLKENNNCSLHDSKIDNLLILIDGTWAEAKRIARDSPTLLDECQQIQFSTAMTQCLYDVIRKEPEDHCLSTLESCVQALRLLEPQNPFVEDAATYLTCTLQELVRKQQLQQQHPKPRHYASPEAKLIERNKVLMDIETKLLGSR